ncbi:hypothetical protein CFN78_11895 [Amycolatopsis antarctica]|uniref:DUF2071 domain-containing protein n=1 Tax=Amycolatopsis antarctica TaxID=1854586 RepID=A0A263D3S3_9PSEU|nr:hypothetical protein CFN78_11895 [Amycolatopsis antarctica]
MLPASPHPLRAVLFSQRWLDLTFVHWPLPPDVVAPLLPAGTEPDCLDGLTYVGLVPFRMADTSVLGSPPVPYAGNFLETNVRLYSVDRQGRRGVVFRSLEASRLLAVLTARGGLGLPYMWARMRCVRDGDELTYTSDRRWPRVPASATMGVRLGEDVATTTELERFLTNRWALHTRFAGRTWLLPNAHGPWTFRRATITHLAENLVRTAGLPAPAGPPVSVLHSPGVKVHFGLPRPV